MVRCGTRLPCFFRVDSVLAGAGAARTGVLRETRDYKVEPGAGSRPKRRVIGPRPQVKTWSPCFSTTESSFSAIPLGRFVPASHFCTVDSLVLRMRAKTG